MPSPLGPDYNSDGEVEGLRRRQLQRDASDAQRRERDALEKSLRETRMKKSAAWQDLVKYATRYICQAFSLLTTNFVLNRMVNLKTCIVDTQESLESIVRTCDAIVEEDEYSKSVSGIG